MGDQMVILQAKRHRYSLNRGSSAGNFFGCYCLCYCFFILDIKVSL